VRFRRHLMRYPVEFRFEPMTEEHRQAVVGIFNDYVANSFAAYPDTPVPLGFFDKMLEMAEGYCAIVATGDDGRVIGYGMLRPYHFASTLKRTAELTYFLKSDCTRQGVGKAMLDFLVREAKRLGIDNLTASVSSLNPASIAFHLKNGFVECGRFSRVGRKFDQDFDVLWFQRRLCD
jgi:L-amino acid N-acyltransferase YncA